MSYTIVKSIQNRDGRIWLNATDNNVWGVIYDRYGRKHYRRSFHWYEWEYGTKYFAEHGGHELLVLIADGVLDGNFQFTGGRLAKFAKSLSRETADAYYEIDYNDPAYKDRRLEIARTAWEAFAGKNSKLRKVRYDRHKLEE
jgi:hypothetical protein